MTNKFGLLIAVLLSTVSVEANSSNSFPLPFSGIYQSLGSAARELTSRQNDSWITIPQNVYVNLVKDRDILELRLNIDVLDSSGQTLYPIENSMWLRHVGDNQLEVYKLDKASGAFKQVGEGACTGLSCSYAYVILAHNNGNRYQQRYTSTITWTAEQAGTSFTQAGSLSAKVSDVADGTDPWSVFKTWSNVFEIKPSP